MINNIKMSFKILKYGINYKTSIVFAILFAIIGFLAEMVGSPGIAALYMPLVGIYFGQIAHSVVQSTMVQTSPHKKVMQTKIPALAMAIVMAIYNTISVIWKLILLNVNPGRKEHFIIAIAFGGIVTIIIMLYFAFAMKLYWPATILFFFIFYPLCFVSGFGGASLFVGGEGLEISISLTGAILFSYVCILIGGMINYGVNMILYKKDYSQQNFKKVLDRAK